MTSKEFVIWLKGFSVACNDFHPTPAQWDTIKEELNKVDQQMPVTFNNSTGNTTFTNLSNRADITYTAKQQLND